MKLIIRLLIISLTISSSHAQQYPHSSYDATFNGGPLSGGVLYNQNGVRLSCQIYKAVDRWGESEMTCEYINKESYGCEDGKYEGQKLNWYRIKFKIENLNLAKQVVFKCSETIAIEIDEENQAAHCCKDKYNNAAGALILKMGPNSSIEFDSQNDGFGGWFISHPKVMTWWLCGYDLVDDAIVNGTNPGGGALGVNDQDEDNGFSTGFGKGLVNSGVGNNSGKADQGANEQNETTSGGNSDDCLIGTWNTSRDGGIKLIIKKDGTFSIFKTCKIDDPIKSGPDNSSKELAKYIGTWTKDGNSVHFSVGELSPDKQWHPNTKNFCHHFVSWNGELSKDYKTLSDFSKSTPCQVSETNSSNQGNNVSSSYSIDPDKGKLIGSNSQALISYMAENTDNPDFKKFSNDINNISTAFKDIYELDAMFGKAGPEDIEAYNQAESIGQAIALGLLIYNLFKEDEVVYTPEQEAAREALRNMTRNTKYVYDEVRYVPHYYEFNQEALDKLLLKKKLYAAYETATASERALYFKYLHTSPAMTIDELKTEYNNLRSKTPEQLISIIADYQKKTTGLENIKHLTNNDFALKDETFKLQYTLVRCYEAMGQTEKAEEVRSKMDYSKANPKVVVQGICDGILEQDNYLVIQSYEVLKRRLEQKGVWSRYEEFNSLRHDENSGIQGLELSDAMYLISLGAIAYIRDGQYLQAEAELDFLADFVERTNNWYLRKQQEKVKKRDELQHDQLLKSIIYAYDQGRIYEKSTRAYLNSVLKKDGGGLELMKEAKAIVPRKSGFVGVLALNTEANMDYLLFKIQMNNEMYDDALATSRIVREGCYLATKDHIRFEKVTLNYKRERYDLAKAGLEVLMSKQGDQPKYLLMYSRVLEKLGEQTEAKEYYTKYEKNVGK